MTRDEIVSEAKRVSNKPCKWADEIKHPESDRDWALQIFDATMDDHDRLFNELRPLRNQVKKENNKTLNLMFFSQEDTNTALMREINAPPPARRRLG